MLPLPAAAQDTGNNCGQDDNSTCDNWDADKNHYRCTFILKNSRHTTPGWSDTPCETTSEGEDDNGATIPGCGDPCETTSSPGAKECFDIDDRVSNKLTNYYRRPCGSDGTPMCWNVSKSKWEESSGGCDAIHCLNSGGTIVLNKFKPDCDDVGDKDPEPSCDPPSYWSRWISDYDDRGRPIYDKQCVAPHKPAPATWLYAYCRMPDDNIPVLHLKADAASGVETRYWNTGTPSHRTETATRYAMYWRSDATPDWTQIYTSSTLRDIAAWVRRARLDWGTWGGQSLLGQFSLGGAQAKCALSREGGTWRMPYGTFPTTHILKPGLDDYRDAEAVEHVCLAAARRLGLDAAHTELERFEDERVVVVTRFDRHRPARGQPFRRIHQEDLCQALGVAPGRKYQSEGGPSPAQAADLL